MSASWIHSFLLAPAANGCNPPNGDVYQGFESGRLGRLAEI